MDIFVEKKEKQDEESRIAIIKEFGIKGLEILDKDAYGTYSYTCKICTKSFIDNYTFEEHRKTCNLDLIERELTEEEEKYLLKVNIEPILLCRYCGMGYDNYKQFIGHQKFCGGNYRLHKNCLTCESCAIKKYAPYKRYFNDYRYDYITTRLQQKNAKFYCTKKRKSLSEKHLEEMENKCYNIQKTKVKEIESKGYKKYFSEGSKFYDELLLNKEQEEIDEGEEECQTNREQQ